jgi:hypothetical protein
MRISPQGHIILRAFRLPVNEQRICKEWWNSQFPFSPQVSHVNGLSIGWTAFGIAGNGKSTAAIYPSALISNLLLQLRLSDFLNP